MTAAIAIALAALLVPVWGVPPLSTAPYLQGITPTEAVVCQFTAAPVALGLRLRGAGGVVEIAPSAPARHHELHATGLRPGTSYRYEVVDVDGAVVAHGELHTASDRDTDPVRFGILGDSGGKPWWDDLRGSALFRLLPVEHWLPPAHDLGAVAGVLSAMHPDFWLHTGDVVYPRGALEDYWPRYFAAFGPLLREAPCYPVLGNHDLMTGDGAPFFTVFALPDAGDERNFTFRDGPLRVIGLDLDHRIGPDDPALVFLREVLRSAAEPWVVVFAHPPAWSAYRKDAHADLRRNLVPICTEAGVDLLCAGHDHNYQRFGQPGELIEVVSGGGGKSLYPIRFDVERLAASASAYHACLVEIDGASLRFSARAIDGRELDRFRIDKAALSAQGKLRGSRARLERIHALLR